MAAKVSDQLGKRLTQLGASDMLEVIIELRDSKESPAQQTQSRQEKIAVMKDSFARDVVLVEDAVRSIGGEVTGHVWINRTVRARVPVDGIQQLSANEQVAKIDVPHELERDVSNSY